MLHKTKNLFFSHNELMGLQKFINTCYEIEFCSNFIPDQSAEALSNALKIATKEYAFSIIESDDVAKLKPCLTIKRCSDEVIKEIMKETNGTHKMMYQVFVSYPPDINNKEYKIAYKKYKEKAAKVANSSKIVTGPCYQEPPFYSFFLVVKNNGEIGFKNWPYLYDLFTGTTVQDYQLNLDSILKWENPIDLKEKLLIHKTPRI